MLLIILLLVISGVSNKEFGTKFNLDLKVLHPDTSPNIFRMTPSLFRFVAFTSERSLSLNDTLNCRLGLFVPYVKLLSSKKID